MTSMLASAAASSSTNIVHRGKASAGPFMLTLCRIVEPVSIRPPESPRLRPFTFFTSRVRQRDGSEPLYLHMGFFGTLAYAERWARAVRGRHPDAIATMSPPAFWQLPDSEEPVGQSIDSRGGSLDGQNFRTVKDDLLTDTQVLSILEMRRSAPAPYGCDEQDGEQIELLRPDDTGIRRALKEAVVHGLPVSFAVQLHWSARPLEPNDVPWLPIFNAHTLYAVESRRTSHSCFFLRLGFFGDPVSAKQVAFHVRSKFASAAVVPVLEEEIARAREACTDKSVIPYLLQQRLDQTPEPSAPDWATVAKPESGSPLNTSQDAETLEQTLSQLAAREMWNDPDWLSDTGVRHLKVEVQERRSGRN